MRVGRIYPPANPFLPINRLMMFLTNLGRLLTSSMVDIYVGPESTHWPLHERLLCYHSPFFASIFYDEKANSHPDENKSYGLPDEDDLSFELLVGWLYSRSIRPLKEEKDIGPLLEIGRASCRERV